MKNTSVTLAVAVLGLLVLASNANAMVVGRVPDAASSSLLLSMALAGLFSARAFWGNRR